VTKPFGALALCFLLGCSTAPRPHAPGAAVPAVRVFERNLLRPSPRRNCAINIVREKGVKGSGLSLYLDGQRIARMSAGEAITIYPPPGRHLLTARPLFSPLVTKQLLLEPGDTTTIRIIDQAGNFELRTADRAWLDSIGRAYRSLVHRL
jgi:hypothetical protein